MKCVHIFGTDRHKRQVDITLLFEYMYFPSIFLEIYFSIKHPIPNTFYSQTLDKAILSAWFPDIG